MIILALSLDVDSFISRAALVPPATHRAVIDISSADRERFISTSLPRGDRLPLSSGLIRNSDPDAVRCISISA